jgi:hypothetical protein
MFPHGGSLYSVASASFGNSCCGHRLLRERIAGQRLPLPQACSDSVPGRAGLSLSGPGYLRQLIVPAAWATRCRPESAVPASQRFDSPVQIQEMGVHTGRSFASADRRRHRNLYVLPGPRAHGRGHQRVVPRWTRLGATAGRASGQADQAKSLRQSQALPGRRCPK